MIKINECALDSFVSTYSELNEADKDSLVEWVSEAAQLFERQSVVIEKLRSACELYKSELIKSDFDLINVRINVGGEYYFKFLARVLPKIPPWLPCPVRASKNS